MKNQPKKKNSLTPIIIIGLVLVIAVGGGVMLYKTSTAPKPKANNTNKTSTPDNSAQKYATAPTGAQPPNMLGSPTAAVTLEEFADFQCGTCAVKHPMTEELIKAYGSRIKFIFRNNPLAIPAHDKAYEAAVAAEAAGMQNKFWAMQNQLFTNQQTWSTAADYKQIWESYAEKIGLDLEKFKNDMAGNAAKSRVENDLQRGKALGVSSTPSFFLNGRLVPFEQVEINAMRGLIDAELAKANSANQNSNPPAANK
jgi:protein-disulfide isomerase